MSLQTASIAQHCKSLRLGAVAPSSPRSPRRPRSATTLICTTSRPCCRRRWRIGSGVRSNCALQEAHLPRIKTLEEFDFSQSPHIPAARIRALAEGGYLERAEPVLLVGDYREAAKCACALGMHTPFRNHLAVKVGHLLEEPYILEQGRSALTRGLNILVVTYWGTERCCQFLHHSSSFMVVVVRGAFQFSRAKGIVRFSSYWRSVSRLRTMVTLPSASRKIVPVSRRSVWRVT